MDARQAAIADEIDALKVGQWVHIDDHEIRKLDRETEVYEVDGVECCFVEAWDIVTGRTAPRARY